MKLPLLPRRSRTRRSLGFTLTEIMTAVTLGGMLMTGTTSFFLSSGRAMFVSTEKLKINRDIRTLTSEMMDNARAANTFLIYPSFEEPDRDSVEDRRWQGSSGDLLVLVYHRPWPTAADVNHITRIVGYYRDPDAEGLGPVRRFDLRYAPSDYRRADTTTVESLLPPETSMADFPQVLELSRGLADERLFFNLENRAVIVNGEIYHGNAAKRVTDTYNFTVSPRN